MCFIELRFQRDGSLNVYLGLAPIQVIHHFKCCQPEMPFGERIVQLQSFPDSAFSFWPRCVRAQHAPCGSITVITVQTAVTERVRWIGVYRSVKVVPTLVELF